MVLTVEGALLDFKKKHDIQDDALLEDLKSQLSTAVESGSEDRKDEAIKEVFKLAETAGCLKVSRIGGGTYGEVFKGIDLKTKETVAVKIIDMEESKDDILVLGREIAALAAGSNCKQLVQYKGTRVIGTQLWILMEFLIGGSLGDKLKKRTFTEAETAVVAREALLGLYHLHVENRIHRDIKAANLLIQSNCQVKLGDLGASAQLTTTKPSADTMIGSPYWMAPEVLQNKHDFKADVWSLGITCIELVHGKPPLSHLPPLSVVMRIPNNPPPKLEGDFSDTFKDFVSLCLIKNPEDRPSVKDLLDHPFIKSAGDIEILKEIL